MDVDVMKKQTNWVLVNDKNLKNLLTYLAQLTSPILNVLRFLNHTVDILKGGDTLFFLLTALRVHTYIHYAQALFLLR